MAAPYPLLRAPLPGYIEPKGASVSGGRFVVTSTLADHQARGSAGTDIANYPRSTGAPVRCMRTGVIYQKYVQPYHNPPRIGDGALIIRIRSKEGNHGYAHLKAFAAGMYVGKTVAAGTIIGYNGHSGTQVNSPHLHTHWQDNAGVHREVYLQMEQSRDMQFNAMTIGGKVNIRLTPAGAIWGSCRPTGIYEGERIVAAQGARLTRRHVTGVTKALGGVTYSWMPIKIPGQTEALWVAKNFVRFI